MRGDQVTGAKILADFMVKDKQTILSLDRLPVGRENTIYSE
jgi:hypothetical protein